ncbi:sphingosine kinase 2 [Aplysia californica]|uniref:Sphingosine kinase 2 n=1 Tax=Aplysia californica TaxID=6500 RepID=A0ABM0JG67_APLCA|nr:sphingosine kinase 2 [Aplysia californica]
MTKCIKMASWRDDVILEGDFFLMPKGREEYKVILTRCGVFYSIISNSSTTYVEKSILVSDIIGCHCIEPNGHNVTAASGNNTNRNGASPPSTPSSPGGDTVSDFGEESGQNDDLESSFSKSFSIPRLSDSLACGFVVFAYPFRKKMFSGKKVRHRVALGFELRATQETFESKKKEIEKWRNMITCLHRGLPINLKDPSSCVPPQMGKMLILINPHSGPGKADIIFKNDVAPMLYEASIPYKVIVTKYAGHASDIVASLNLTEWYGIVIVSGDGLIFEALNGIMKRADWASSIKLPVGCIPGGSGNALCCSINYAAGEPIESSMALHSAFILVKHRVVPMDLVVMQMPELTVYSFLSMTWGLLADIDYESEKYRSFGEARFTVGAIRRILSLRIYKGKISFLPIAEYSPRNDSSTNKKVLSKIRRFSLRSRSSSKSTVSSAGSDSPHLQSYQRHSVDSCEYQPVTAKPRSESSPGVTIGHLASGDCKEDKGDKSPVSSHVVDAQPPGPPDATTPVTAVERATASEGQGESVSGVAESVNNNNASQTELQVSPVEPPQSALGVKQNEGIVAGSDGNVSQTDNDHYAGSTNSCVDQRDSSDHVDAKTQVNDTLPNADVLNLDAAEFSDSKRSSFTVLEDTQEVGVTEEMYHGKKADFSPVPTPLLPGLDEPVPDNWVTIEGEFVVVCAAYQSHLGSDVLVAPDAHLHDGCIHLMLVREGISRNTLLNLFKAIATGSHVHSPYVEIVKVLAFRLEPISTNGNIMVDGERFAPNPLQAQILPGLARAMAIQ